MITLFCFDFAGCGRSEGEFISLGWYERDDVQTVVEWLRGSGRVSTIGIWGRSMGAVTGLMHADRDPSIAGLVLDSPFSNLRTLAEELAKNHSVILYIYITGLYWAFGVIFKYIHIIYSSINT
jgi:alpha/beta superfamily hydrolase